MRRKYENLFCKQKQTNTFAHYLCEATISLSRVLSGGAPLLQSLKVKRKTFLSEQLPIRQQLAKCQCIPNRQSNVKSSDHHDNLHSHSSGFTGVTRYQQHAGLQLVVLQLQQEVTRPQARFKLTILNLYPYAYYIKLIKWHYLENFAKLCSAQKLSSNHWIDFPF